jgi:S-adenosylmethionine hydrolase
MDGDQPAFRPNGIITLTSDFGTAGPYVGVLQGVMLGQLPTARIVDITHDTEVHWPVEAGFWIEHAYRSFPAGTVHVAVVESGGGTDRPGVVVELDGHAFVGPDNGLLARLAERPGARVYAITLGTLKQLGTAKVAPTFRGRDAQAPVGGALAAGKLAPADVGPEVDDWAPSLLEAPEVKGQEARGQVVTVDSFGNVVTNVHADLVSSLSPAEVLIGGRVLPLRRSYGEVAPGDVVALVNAFGVLEVARAQRSAADLLGVGRGAPVVVRRRFART